MKKQFDDVLNMQMRLLCMNHLYLLDSLIFSDKVMLFSSLKITSKRKYSSGYSGVFPNINRVAKGEPIKHANEANDAK